MRILIAVLLLIGLMGCASNNVLLQTDYAKLSDSELLKYFHRLDSQITYLEQSFNPPAPADDSGMTGQGTANINLLTMGATRDLNALRERRLSVRMELDKRGLEP
jgi:hypothetical protein